MTFLSDFGLSDSYVGEVKGVILACVPGARITDITHGMEPGNIEAASYVLNGAYRYFMPGTIHLAVVDPGVGSERDIIVVRTRRYTFVAPDNGLVYESARADGIRTIHAVEIPRFMDRISRVFRGNAVVEQILREGASFTFHGRDLFAPFVGYLLRGRRLSAVSREKSSMVELTLPGVREEPGRIVGKVVYIDRFGNLVTNIPGERVGAGDAVFMKASGNIASFGTLKRTYSDAGRGEALALVGSRGFIEIAVREGRARERFGARCGDEVMVSRAGVR